MAENEEQSVLTLGSLCVPCCERSIDWTKSYIQFIVFFNIFVLCEFKLYFIYIFCRFLWPLLIVSLSIVTCTFELMFIYHGADIKDYSFATECFCYFLIVFSIPIVYITVLLNRNNIMQILDTMNRDFLFICNLESKYRFVYLCTYPKMITLCES